MMLISLNNICINKSREVRILCLLHFLFDVFAHTLHSCTLAGKVRTMCNTYKYFSDNVSHHTQCTFYALFKYTQRIRYSTSIVGITLTMILYKTKKTIKF